MLRLHPLRHRRFPARRLHRSHYSSFRRRKLQSPLLGFMPMPTPDPALQMPILPRIRTSVIHRCKARIRLRRQRLTLTASNLEARVTSCAKTKQSAHSPASRARSC
jgi:hypothetical protein